MWERERREEKKLKGIEINVKKKVKRNRRNDKKREKEKEKSFNLAVHETSSLFFEMKKVLTGENECQNGKNPTDNHVKFHFSG